MENILLFYGPKDLAGGSLLKISDDKVKNLRKYDCVVISTDHSSYDYGFIAKNSRLVVDIRNATKEVYGMVKGKKIVKA